MSRIPDVGNPWLDAGIVAFSTLKLQHATAMYWEKWYPADFITESFPGQFRNWFYALLALSTMMSDGQPPFRTLLGHGHVRDQYGNEMHKSTGNSIEFNAAADKGGEIRTRRESDPLQGNGRRRDALALLPAQSRGEPELRPRPGERGAGQVLSSSCGTATRFFCNYALVDGFDPTAPRCR